MEGHGCGRGKWQQGTGWDEALEIDEQLCSPCRFRGSSSDVIPSFITGRHDRAWFEGYRAWDWNREWGWDGVMTDQGHRVACTLPGIDK
jgi:hypothetical protein